MLGLYGDYIDVSSCAAFLDTVLWFDGAEIQMERFKAWNRGIA